MLYVDSCSSFGIIVIVIGTMPHRIDSSSSLYAYVLNAVFDKKILKNYFNCRIYSGDNQINNAYLSIGDPDFGLTGYRSNN